MNERTRLRTLAGLSLRDLEDRTGISKSRLSLWEHGEATLHTSEIRSINNVILELSSRHLDEISRLVHSRIRNRRRGRADRGNLKPLTVAGKGAVNRRELNQERNRHEAQ